MKMGRCRRGATLPREGAGAARRRQAVEELRVAIVMPRRSASSSPSSSSQLPSPSLPHRECRRLSFPLSVLVFAAGFLHHTWLRRTMTDGKP